MAAGSLLAVVVKLVDTPDLGSGAARCESSSLSDRTNLENNTSQNFDSFLGDETR